MIKIESTGIGQRKEKRGPERHTNGRNRGKMRWRWRLRK